MECEEFKFFAEEFRNERCRERDIDSSYHDSNENEDCITDDTLLKVEWIPYDYYGNTRFRPQYKVVKKGD